MKIEDKWVDVRSWKASHPGGAALLERFKNQDATDAFTSLHSKEAWEKVNRMKSVSPPPSDLTRKPKNSSLAFRRFREDLVRNGWFERSWGWDMFYVGMVVGLCVVGTMLAWSYPVLAVLLIGIGMQQGGWVAHDYVHGRGWACFLIGRLLGGCVNAFSPTWWSDKHNTHHVHTNQLGIDHDISNDPILHLWIPEEHKDVFYRRFQHMYYHVVYAFLYVSWRIQSFQWSWARMDRVELAMMAFNYLWLLSLPLTVSIPSVLLGGWLVAEIVTATHQSEEILNDVSFDFVEDQFRTTRDVEFNNVFFNYLWGGMQYQLEHHLFPTMPKYRYGALVPLVKKFAAENGLDYRYSNGWEILQLNYDTMKKYAAAAAS